MAWAVACGQAWQAAHYFDVKVFFSDRHADEVVGAARGKHCIGSREGDKAFACHPGCRTHQQLLGHSHLVETVGMSFGEDVQVGVFREVGG